MGVRRSIAASILAVSTFRDDAIWHDPLMAAVAEADPQPRADLLAAQVLVSIHLMATSGPRPV